MGMAVDPVLAAFAAELSIEIDRLLEKYPKVPERHGPVDVQVRTIDGLAAKFFEEGIEFYPKGDE